MNLLTFIAPLAVAATFMMPADAANHKELPALGNTAHPINQGENSLIL